MSSMLPPGRQHGENKFILIYCAVDYIQLRYTQNARFECLVKLLLYPIAAYTVRAEGSR